MIKITLTSILQKGDVRGPDTLWHCRKAARGALSALEGHRGELGAASTGEMPQHVGLCGLGASESKVKPTALSGEEAISLSTCQQGRDKLENSEGC